MNNVSIALILLIHPDSSSTATVQPNETESTVCCQKCTYKQGRRVEFLFGGLNFYLRLCSICQILFGGLEHWGVQSASLIFARLNFIGGLKPPKP